MIPRWSVAAIVAGSLLILAACTAGVAILGWPTVDWLDLMPSTPATTAGVVLGLALLALGGWLIVRIRRGARRRRRQGKAPRAAARGRSGRGQVVAPAAINGGAGAVATITLFLPSPAAASRGGRRAGWPVPPVAGRPASSRRRAVQARTVGEVTAAAARRSAAVTLRFPRVRAEVDAHCGTVAASAAGGGVEAATQVLPAAVEGTVVLPVVPGGGRR